MNDVIAMILKQIFQVGMSTTNVISRIGYHEPEEDIILMEMVNKKQITNQN